MSWVNVGLSDDEKSGMNKLTENSREKLERIKNEVYEITEKIQQELKNSGLIQVMEF